jgi:hypothetical protein
MSARRRGDGARQGEGSNAEGLDGSRLILFCQ